jgi:cobalamin biosynthetic protein CobC
MARRRPVRRPRPLRAKRQTGSTFRPASIRPWPETHSPIDWRALPDEQALAALEEAAAAHFGCHPDHVCAVPGTEIGLRLAADLLPRDAAHGVPGYRTHGAMIAGSTPIMPEAMASSTAATLILANPNNPDGRLLSRDHLLALVEARLDRARRSLCRHHPGHSLAPMIDDARRLVIFRSFGKFFGLAGLRLGFVLGPRPLLATLRARLGAWPVCAAALAIGTAAYRDTGWIAQMRARLVAEADALDAALARRGYPRPAKARCSA